MGQVSAKAIFNIFIGRKARIIDLKRIGDISNVET
jgi:hypothetical protein